MARSSSRPGHSGRSYILQKSKSVIGTEDEAATPDHCVDCSGCSGCQDRRRVPGGDRKKKTRREDSRSDPGAGYSGAVMSRTQKSEVVIGKETRRREQRIFPGPAA